MGTPPKGVTPAPESQLIKAARQKMVPRISQAQAARKAGISQSRWRDIERGWNWISKGKAGPARIPQDTLAKAALAVEVTPGQLTAVGRRDAAKYLMELIISIEDPGFTDLSKVSNQDLLAELDRRLSENTASDIVQNPPLRAVARRVDPDDQSTWSDS